MEAGKRKGGKKGVLLLKDFGFVFEKPFFLGFRRSICLMFFWGGGWSKLIWSGHVRHFCSRTASLKRESLIGL